MTEQLVEKCKKYQSHFSGLLKVPCNVIDVPENKMCIRDRLCA